MKNNDLISHRIEVMIEPLGQKILKRGGHLELSVGEQAMVLRFADHGRRGRRSAPEADGTPAVPRRRRRRKIDPSTDDGLGIVTDGTLPVPVFGKKRGRPRTSTRTGSVRNPDGKRCNYCKRNLEKQPHTPGCRVYKAQLAAAERARAAKAAANVE